MNEEINRFLDSKKILDPLLRNLVNEFIEIHTNLYGDVVSFKQVLKRLNNNLDCILIEKLENNTGIYVGFYANTIYLNYDRNTLDDKQLMSLKNDLFCGLVYALYTIKNNDKYRTESLLFCNFEQQLDGNIEIVEGNDIFIKPIIDYISSSILQKNISSYNASALSISYLSKMIGMEDLIYCFISSNINEFKSNFDKLSKNAYDYFVLGLEYFKYNFYEDGKKVMNNFFHKKIPEEEIITKQRKKLEKITNKPEKKKKDKGFIITFIIPTIVTIIEIIILYFAYFKKILH